MNLRSSNPVDMYAQRVLSGELPAGKYHRLACARHMRIVNASRPLASRIDSCTRRAMRADAYNRARYGSSSLRGSSNTTKASGPAGILNPRSRRSSASDRFSAGGTCRRGCVDSRPPTTSSPEKAASHSRRPWSRCMPRFMKGNLAPKATASRPSANKPSACSTMRNGWSSAPA